MSERVDLIADLRQQHRQRQFAIKEIQRSDRSIESFVTINVIGVPQGAVKGEMQKYYALGSKLMKNLKKIDADKVAEEHRDVKDMIDRHALSSEGWLKLKKLRESKMEKIVRELPAYDFVVGTPGVGSLGFAQIVAEAGDLSNYPNVAKLWKRLGLAPYEGHAMSTWKRKPDGRALTSAEWVANPFKPERYAMIFQIASWLWVKQWIGKNKDPDGKGKPNGHYGEIYAARRARTAETHPEWTPMHAHMDALRIMVKNFVADLWSAWRRAIVSVSSIEAMPAASSILVPA